MISSKFFNKVLDNRLSKDNFVTKLLKYGFEQINPQHYRLLNKQIKKTYIKGLYKWTIWENGQMVYIADTQRELLDAVRGG